MFYSNIYVSMKKKKLNFNSKTKNNVSCKINQLSKH